MSKITSKGLQTKPLFPSLKVLPMVYNKLVDLDLLKSLHCHIKPLYEFQECDYIFHILLRLHVNHLSDYSMLIFIPCALVRFKPL